VIMFRYTDMLTVPCVLPQMMNTMGGDDLPDLDGAEDEVGFLTLDKVEFTR